MNVLCKVSLMLALSRSLLHRKYTAINVLVSIILMCNLYIIFLSKIAPRYFTLFTNGIFSPFNVTWDSDDPTSARNIDHLSLLLIYFNVPALNTTSKGSMRSLTNREVLATWAR
jgi:hypothetical protein